jgi:hypothetical protein
MADIPFSDLLTLILTELSQTVEQTADRAELTQLHLNDIDLELPAHLQLQTKTSESSSRLIVTLPSTRETPPTGRLGRIRINIAAQPPVPSTQETL